MKHLWLAVALMLIVVPSGVADSPRGESQAVTIANMQFSPGTLNIHTGDTVVWTNSDDRDHTVVAADGSFRSDNIGPGRTYSHRFAAKGSFAYACRLHPRMKGTIVVKD